MRDHLPISIAEFNGLYDRGMDDAIPADHLAVCDNMQFLEREVVSRFGFTLPYTAATNIKRIALYKRIGEATRLLILDSSGNLFDSTSGVILSIATMTDFKVQTFFGRAYITPIDAANGIGVSGEFLYVYNGTSCRKAAGTAPTGTLTVADSGLSGHVEAGFHLYAVAFETASGFITKPGPATYGILESDGTKKVALTGIPVGPVGTVKRYLLTTKSILTYDGNQNGYEFFFIPGADINDNSTTTATVDFYDADLIESAEYLFDQYEEIPAGVGISEYRGRLILWNTNYIYVSKAGEPESIDALVGLTLVGPGEAGYITDCVEYREVLYIHKLYRAYVTSDNGGDPSTWIMSSLDKGIGCSTHGIIKILDAQGSSADKFLVASLKGLVLFSGYYQEPELSWKIERIWERINKAYFHLVHGFNDTKNHRLYIAVPLDNATSCSHILYADYSKGLDSVNIRWSIWSSSIWTPTSILIDLSSSVPFLRIGSVAGVYSQGTSRLDVAAAIPSTVRTALAAVGNGTVGHYHSVRFRANGSGTLDCYLYPEDVGSSTQLASTTLASAPAKDYTLLANFINEKCAIEFKVTEANEWFSLSRLDLYAKIIWASRPI